MIGRVFTGAATLTLAAATALLAEPPQRPAKATSERQICRSSGEVGSRLARSRACHTEQEWAELRRQTRQNIDHIQNARPWNQEPPH